MPSSTYPDRALAAHRSAIARIVATADAYGLAGFGTNRESAAFRTVDFADAPEVPAALISRLSPGAAFYADDEYEYEHDDWTTTTTCPADGEDVGVLACVMEIRTAPHAPHGSIARILAHVHDIPAGTGFVYLPVTAWIPVPAVEESDETWRGWLEAADETVSAVEGRLTDKGLSHAIPWVAPRRVPTVDGHECPCDDCQIAAAHLLLAGGLDGMAAVERRVRHLNRKLRGVQPGLSIDWRADVTFCGDCDGAHLSALASCTDDRGGLLWAMGGDTATEALDAIESWAWALLVTDLAGKLGVGRGDA
jgi:hypothetical protein